MRRSVAEGAASPPGVLRREAIHRRSLAAADLAALACSLVAVLAVEGQELRPASVIAVPFVVLVNKLLGLYDRDELVIRKTTLEEAPAILNAATLYTLILYLLHDTLFTGSAERAAAAVGWVVFIVAATLARVGVRMVAGRLVSPERIALRRRLGP